MEDFYQILGISKTATSEEIKQAYKKLAMKHHPDRGGDQTQFQKITEAYETLGDVHKRRDYDHGGATQGFHFRHGFDSVDSMFEQFFNQAHRRARAVQLSVWISLEDAAIGGNRTININDHSGQKLINISIPQGVPDGATVRYPNLGPSGQDLIICYRIHPHAKFKRTSEHDLTTDESVDFWDLILGCKKTIFKLDGTQLEFLIPPMTQPNSTLRLRRQGLTTQSGVGDLLININAVLPKQIPKDLLSAIEKLKNS